MVRRWQVELLMPQPPRADEGSHGDWPHVHGCMIGHMGAGFHYADTPWVIDELWLAAHGSPLVDLMSQLCLPASVCCA